MRVIIIGAGPLGLLAGKHLIEDGHDCSIFEQTGTLGGTWNYTDFTDKDENGLPVFTGMYKNFITNAAAPYMTDDGFPYASDLTTTYLTQTQMLEYVQKFAHHFNLHSFIQYYCQVTCVKPIGDKWEVTIRNVKENRNETLNFDVVVICSGRFNVPRFPNIKGRELFQGNQLHSYTYRDFTNYKNQKVLIIGASVSGKDIADQVSTVAEHVFLSHRNSKEFSIENQNISQKPQVVRIYENEVEFDDGTKQQVDSIIYATGYLHQFSFLSDDCKIEGGDYIKYLYKHTINIEHPSMFFLGILAGMPLMHFTKLQIKLIRKLILNEVSLPTKSEMLADVDKRLERLKHKGLATKYFHQCQDDERVFLCHDLAATGHFEPTPAEYYEMYRKTRRS